jgi:hypothetical protein
MAPVEPCEAPATKIIEQRSDAFLEGIVEQKTVTLGSKVFIVSVVFPRLPVSPVPESFLSGLAECKAGRTVEMDYAMTQSPPSRGV